jgi:hypothetical protein
MAPEQARGEPLDRRADVYALGAVLFELLAGRPVRDTDEGKQLAALHDLMTGVPYAPLPETVPVLVRNVVDRALARDPKQRFATAEELRRALEQVMLATGQGATTDDVANVLAHFSRERTAKRKDAIERALRAATDGRVNAATIVAPLSGRVANAQLASGPPGSGGADGSGSHGSHPSQAGMPAGAVPGHFVPMAPPAAVDTLQTGPSMRTIGPASMNTQSMAGSSAAKVFAGVLVLGLVALLGVVAGVIVTRRGEHAAIVAAHAPAGSGAGAMPAALSGVAVGASGDLLPGAAVPAVASDPTTPPTGISDTGAPTPVTSRASKDAGTIASPSSARKAGAKPGGKPGAKQPGDGDEYGF